MRGLGKSNVDPVQPTENPALLERWLVAAPTVATPPLLATRQRCLAHRLRNPVAKVPEGHWSDFKARVTPQATAIYPVPLGRD